jgi:F420-0:gamma-glutamyl ligase
MGVATRFDEAFLRLLGDIDCARDAVRDVPAPKRPALRWNGVQPSGDASPGEEEVRIAEDWLQPHPLLVQVLFQPIPEGVYDVQWLAPVGTDVTAGEPVARCYRTSDGQVFEQRAPFDLRVAEWRVERNRRVVRGDPLCAAAIPQLALDLGGVEELIAQRVLGLAQAANAVVKGIMGALGESGQVTESVDPVAVVLEPGRGYDALLDQIVGALAPPAIQDGDVVVVSEKVIAIAQRRLFPVELLYDNDPKTTDREGREELAALVADHVPHVAADDLICADVLSEPAGLATAGVADPNGVAHDLAWLLEERHGVRCDVVVSDTDTGLDVGETLIGCPTLGATPLGATAGLVLYECMRVANAAEFVRGAHRGIPLVVCHPHARRLRREGLGQPRGYPGRLDAARERLLGFA